MNSRRLLTSSFLAMAIAVGAFASVARSSSEHGHGGEAGHGAHEEAPSGPHGGRLLEQDGFSVEVTIFETGAAPRLRVFASSDGSAAAPSDVKLQVELTRLGREPEVHRFSARGDFLEGDRVVAEPHSFAVRVEAEWKGRRFEWHYEQEEARVAMEADVAAANGVELAVAGPRALGRELRLTGRIGIPTDRIVTVRPRFAGVVREARGEIGDEVARGERLAEVEGSASLSRFAVEAPIAGVLLDRRAVVGAAVGGDDPLYTVADLSEVWADLDVYGDDTSKVRVGEAVTVRVDAGVDADGEKRETSAQAAVSYVSPLRDVHTQTMLARVVLPNGDRSWPPGAFVTATIAVDEREAAVAVPAAALQAWRDRDAVFVRVGDVFEARPVRLGRRGAQWVEVLDGVEAGDAVATGNTFVLRAEIEKAGASHDH